MNTPPAERDVLARLNSICEMKRKAAQKKGPRYITVILVSAGLAVLWLILTL